MKKDQIYQLRKEAAILIKGEGEGFVPADDSAPNRVFSKIPGVKNIRFSDIDPEGTLCVKTHGNVDLPSSIIVNRKEYNLKELYTNEIVK